MKNVGIIGGSGFIGSHNVKTFLSEGYPNLSFEIVTVSPVGVMGKALSQRQDSTSMGLQYLFKNKIAPNPFIQMFYDNNIYFALVDVAEGVYNAATTNGIHGRNYLLTSESYKVSDITLMLNNQAPEGKPKIIYSNSLAKKELKINFKAAQIPLNQFSE